MLSILWYQLAAFLGASLLHIGVIGIALAGSRRYWPLIYLAGLLVACSLLSLQAFVTFKPAVIFTVLVVVTLGNTLFLKNIRFERKFFGPLAVFVLVLLGVDCLYASFPDYRYDQWSYHLLVGKQLVRGGAFSPPVIYDHIYFSGTYEFLTVIPRYFWDDDIFAHCFANGFSYLTFVTALGGLIVLYLRSYGVKSYLFLPVLAAILFSIPDHEVIYSSKPDALLICFALAVLWLLTANDAPGRLRHFLLPLFIAGPVAFKLTYIHFSVAAFVAWLVLVLLRRYPLNGTTLRLLAFGSVAALIVVLPYLAKNYVLFGNPVHPVQVGIFQSSYWTPEFAKYWDDISIRAKNGAEYMTTLFHVPFALVKINAWYLILIVAAIALGWTKRRQLLQGATTEVIVILVLLLSFLMLWPLFYYHAIYARFVYPILAVVIGAFLLIFGKTGIERFPAVLFLLIPVLGNSSFDVKLPRLSASLEKPEQFFDNGRIPHKHWIVDRALNEHRAREFPEANFRQKRALVESDIAYFLDTERIDINGSDINYQKKHAPGYGSGCPWALLDAYDVRYLRTIYMSFSEWPKEYQAVINAAIQVDRDNSVRYLPTDTIKFHLANCNKHNG